MFSAQAFEYSQGGKSLYLALARAKDLIPYVEIDAWREDNPNGYQRALKIRRSKRFADFLSKFNGMFHQTVLLNVRNATDATFKNPHGNFGTLEIRGKLYQVDGQHRLAGLRTLIEDKKTGPIFQDYFVPLLISVGLERAAEALQFFIINSTQVGVKADLKDRLVADVIKPLISDALLREVIGIKGDRSVTEEAISVCDEMSKNDQSVWKNRIVLPDQRLTGYFSISQRAFTESIKPVLENDIISATFQNFPDDIVDPLINYWNAIKELCPRTFGDNFKEYEMLKTKGASVMHKIFPTVLLYCRGDHSQNKMKELLSKIDEMNEVDWSKKGSVGIKGTSQKVFSEISEGFIKQLKE